MSETHENHDPHGGQRAPLASGPTGSGPRPANRPASGAREVEQPEQVDAGWQGGQGATDFLGLDPEVRGNPTAQAAPNTPVDPALRAALESESWLFTLERGDTTTPADAATTATELANQFGSELAAHGGYDAQDSGLEPSAPAASGIRPFTPKRKSVVPMLAFATVVLALGAGGWYAWNRWGAPAPVEIATNTKPTTKTAPKSKPAPATTPTAAQPVPGADAALSGTPSIPVEPDTVAAIEPAPSGTTPSGVADSSSSVPTQDVTFAGTDTWRDGQNDFGADSLPILSVPTPPSRPHAVRLGEKPVITTVVSAGGRAAVAEDYAGLWTDTAIPTAEIHAKGRLRTMNVGLVRALLSNGAFFEGDLYAVGEGRIWLDLPLGRIALEAGDVTQLVALAGVAGSGSKTEHLAGLPRVEVQLEHATLVGRIVEREGGFVTLVTDQGMRVRVEAIDVRPAHTGASRLVGIVAKGP